MTSFPCYSNHALKNQLNSLYKRQFLGENTYQKLTLAFTGISFECWLLTDERLSLGLLSTESWGAKRLAIVAKEDGGGLTSGMMGWLAWDDIEAWPVSDPPALASV